ncbi:MAG: glycosyltransferase family 4 protein [Chloroflexi bacterium]|nr:glycosyltransferase family 4 protein [Chloroflexota bacterium]MCL5275876.1 glycosyltransferase family 4 protein [Chloroflexota bacterium]
MKLAFVVPRYGEKILGGAETLARCLAEDLISSGYSVSVFTTCSTDLITWSNTLAPGRSIVNGVTVERFPVHSPWQRCRYDSLHSAILTGQKMAVDEQFEWIDSAAHSPRLYQALAQQQGSFDFIFVIPYLFGISYYAAAITPSRTILWPCLHDEAYAYLVPTQLMLRSCRGIMFNTEPEYRLARQKLSLDHPGARIVGFGLRELPGDGERFRRTTGIREPFVLYSGRLESSKNVPLLVNYFIHYKETHIDPLRLVLMGGGNLMKFDHPDIVSIGFQQGTDKLDAYLAASLLCQPSVNESFSIVIMESWLAGVPVLVHRDCAVTRYHVTRSGGGLYFGNYDEFEATLDLMLANRTLAERMGNYGRAYVRSNYSTAAILARFEQALDHWRGLK